MKSEAQSVDDYLEEVPAQRLESVCRGQIANAQVGGQGRRYSVHDRGGSAERSVFRPQAQGWRPRAIARG